MSDFSEFSPEAKAAIEAGGITDVEDLKVFSVIELQDIFKMSLKDIVSLRKKRAREDDCSEDSESTAKNAGPGDTIFGQINTDMCARALLPSKWGMLNAVSFRAALSAIAPGWPSAHIHVRGELDFLLSLVAMMNAGPPHVQQQKLIIWAHMMQQVHKINYPFIASEVKAIWDAATSREAELTDENLLKLYLKTKGELEQLAKKQHHQRPFPRPFRPPPGLVNRRKQKGKQNKTTT